MNDNVLSIQNVTKKYGNKVALRDFSLELGRHKIVGLLGPNGAGKTTLMKLIVGLLTPTSGQILVNDNPIGVKSKLDVSYLPDYSYLPDNTTIENLVKMFADFYSNFSSEKAFGLIYNLNLDVNTKLKHLSKGNKEKIQLIMAMSRDADLYVLDEPIGGVDPAAREYILNTILRNHSPNSVILISTHLIYDIEEVLDEAIFINNGELVVHDSVENIINEHRCSLDEYFKEVFRCY